MVKIEVVPYTLDFKFPAKTSRGSMEKRDVLFIQLSNKQGYKGIGEIAPIPNLSPDVIEKIPELLKTLQSKLKDVGEDITKDFVSNWTQKHIPNDFSSVKFGFEVAFLDMINGGDKYIFNKDTANIHIPINGLIWMGNSDFLKKQIKEKLDNGYRCIKLKVGNLDFDTDVEMVRDIRSISDDLIIRLDANGGFPVNKVLHQIAVLSNYKIHSLEQPILPSQHKIMELICRKSTIPIALDEELVGVHGFFNKIELLQKIHPQYLVLKPSLHGGFESVEQWIGLAETHNIDWWVTSYLESNIGLNAIAQFISGHSQNTLHQGLGTGNLYHNNIHSPLTIEKEIIKYDTSKTWGKINF